jgi:hypothetical protein
MVAFSRKLLERWLLGGNNVAAYPWLSVARVVVGTGCQKVQTEQWSCHVDTHSTGNSKHLHVAAIRENRGVCFGLLHNCLLRPSECTAREHGCCNALNDKAVIAQNKTLKAANH